jgi:flagellar hook-basal body protein
MGFRPTTQGAFAAATDTLAAASYTKPGTNFAALGVVPGDAIAFDTGGIVAQAVIASITGAGSDTLNFTAATNLPAGALAAITDTTPWTVNGTPMYSEILGTDAVTTTTLTRAGKDWVAAGVHPGSFVRFNTATGPVVATVGSVGGAGNSTITFETPLTTAPAAGSLFRIDGLMDAHSGAGRIRIDGNVGAANRISNLQMRVVNGSNLTTLTELASAAGESVVTNATVHDSLGTPRVVELTFALQYKSDRGNRFVYYAESEADSDLDRVIGTGFIEFNPDGSFRSQSPLSAISLDLANTGANTPLVVTPDFSSISGFNDQLSEVALTDQDGFAEGTLNDFSVGADGIVTGIFTNGLTRNIAQVVLARFNNPNGLEALGSNLFREAANSGLAITGTPGTFGRGTLRSGFLEESNVDIARQFTDLIVAQRSFQANARTIRVSDELLQDLVNII